MKGKERKYQKGITLIALVITIVVLLILAGVTLSIVFNGGIINKSQTAVDSYSEQSAREKLEIELINMLAEKVTNKAYNKDKFLTEKLFEAGFSVNGDIVIVDGWQFEIDRNAPKIINSLGKGTKNEDIKIELSQEVSNDYTASTVTVKITYSGELKEININGEKINPIPEAVDGVYTITKEIRENKTVGILVKDTEDNYNIGNIPVVDLTEDMEIRTAEDFNLFRDKVNEGRTFEGKTVTLSKNLDLNKGKYEILEDGTVSFSDDAISWIPIGNYSANSNNIFAGVFDGNNYTISGIYINNLLDYQGLFGTNSGTIKNVKLDNGYIIAGNIIGGIVGHNLGTIENNQSKLYIEAKNTNTNGYSIVGGMVGWCELGIINNCVNYGNVKSIGPDTAGICGYSNSNITIKNCKNLCKYIECTGTNSKGNSLVAGICGNNFGNIENSYNTANIIGKKGCVGGVAGSTEGKISSCFNTGKIESLGVNDNNNNTVGGIVGFDGIGVQNCYNTGEIVGTSRMIGGIVGSSVNGSTISTVTNCYNTGTISGQTYCGGIIGNGKSSNSFYLEGTANYGVGNSTIGSNTGAASEKEADLKLIANKLGTEFTIDDENINNGYPILKWQLER